MMSYVYYPSYLRDLYVRRPQPAPRRTPVRRRLGVPAKRLRRPPSVWMTVVDKSAGAPD